MFFRLSSATSATLPKEGEMKQDIDIERLLIWAYRDQKADRLCRERFRPQGPNVSLTGVISGLIELGCRVDKSGYAERVLAAESLREKMSDLEVIDRAVMSLDEFWIDPEGGIWDRSRAARAGGAIERQGQQWVLVMPGGGVPLSQAGVSVVVILAAKAGEPPEWYPGWRAPVGRKPDDAAAKDKRGRARKLYDGPSVAEVQRARAEYEVWLAALALLADALSGVLDDWRVMPRAGGCVPPWKNPKQKNIQTLENVA